MNINIQKDMYSDYGYSMKIILKNKQFLLLIPMLPEICGNVRKVEKKIILLMAPWENFDFVDGHPPKCDKL